MKINPVSHQCSVRNNFSDRQNENNYMNTSLAKDTFCTSKNNAISFGVESFGRYKDARKEVYSKTGELQGHITETYYNTGLGTRVLDKTYFEPIGGISTITTEYKSEKNRNERSVHTEYYSGDYITEYYDAAGQLATSTSKMPRMDNGFKFWEKTFDKFDNDCPKGESMRYTKTFKENSIYIPLNTAELIPASISEAKMRDGESILKHTLLFDGSNRLTQQITTQYEYDENGKFLGTQKIMDAPNIYDHLQALLTIMSYEDKQMPENPYVSKPKEKYDKWQKFVGTETTYRTGYFGSVCKTVLKAPNGTFTEYTDYEKGKKKQGYVEYANGSYEYRFYGTSEKLKKSLLVVPTIRKDNGEISSEMTETVYENDFSSNEQNVHSKVYVQTGSEVRLKSDKYIYMKAELPQFEVEHFYDNPKQPYLKTSSNFEHDKRGNIIKIVSETSDLWDKNERSSSHADITYNSKNQPVSCITVKRPARGYNEEEVAKTEYYPNGRSRSFECTRKYINRHNDATMAKEVSKMHYDEEGNPKTEYTEVWDNEFVDRKPVLVLKSLQGRLYEWNYAKNKVELSQEYKWQQGENSQESFEETKTQIDALMQS